MKGEPATLEESLAKMKEIAMNNGNKSQEFTKAETKFIELLNSANPDEIEKAIEFAKNNRIEDYCPFKLIERMECA